MKTESKNTNINKNEDDNISINSEKIEPDEDSVGQNINSGTINQNLVVNASFSRNNHDNSSLNIEQQSVISNLINSRKGDEKSILSYITMNNEANKSKMRFQKDLMKKGSQGGIYYGNNEEKENEIRRMYGLLKEKETEAGVAKKNYEEYRKKLNKQIQNFKNNKEKLERVRQNNALMKEIICKLINSK